MYHKWEYKVVQIERDGLEKTLGDYGDQGWELVDANKPAYSAKHQCIFKRPVLKDGKPVLVTEESHEHQVERQGA